MTYQESGLVGSLGGTPGRNAPRKAALVTPCLSHLPFHPSCFLGYGAAVLAQRYDLDVIDLNAEIHGRHGDGLNAVLRAMDDTSVVWETMHLQPLYSVLEDRIDGYYDEIPWNSYHVVYVTAPAWFPTVPTKAVLRLTSSIRRISPETNVVFFSNSLGAWTDERELKQHLVHVAHLNDLFAVQAEAGPVMYDVLPTPAYEHREKYLFDLVPFVLKHGCSWARCRFCSLCKGWNAGYLERSSEIVIKELEILVDRYAPKVLVCRDNSINGDNLMEFCGSIERLGLPWCGMSRADLSGEQIEALGRARCRMIFFGLESGSDKTLRAVNKGITSQQMSDFIKRLYDAGIVPAPSIVVGAPGETRADYEETIRFMADHRRYLEVVNVYPFMATPHSDFGSQDERPSPDTVVRLMHFTMKCEDLGLKVCVGEQCAEYVLFKRMYADHITA
ncbi:MAG: radical SAM protein [Pseudomonadota bacterium]